MSRSVVGAGLGALPPVLPWALNHVVMTGQSTSVGAHGLPVVSTSQPFKNVQMYDPTGAYNLSLPNLSSLGLRPLIALPNDRNSGQVSTFYPINLYGESSDVRMVNQLSAWLAAIGAPAFCTSCVGASSQSLATIQKGGTTCYAASMYEAQVVHRVAPSYGFGTHGFLCTVLDHGQADALNVNYGSGVVTLQSNYQTDLQGWSGQTRPIPMLIMQQHSEPLTLTAGENLSGLQQLAICQASPSSLVFAGPGYQYAMFTDNVHYVTPSYLLRGELMAFVLWQLLTPGRVWKGLWPTSWSRTGNVVTIVFNVPLGGQLVLDSLALQPPHLTGTYASWASAFGFEAWSGGYGGSVVGINSIAVGTQSVAITCASQPDTVCYAHTPDIQGQGASPAGGRTGNLRGSVAHPVGLSGVAQYDWAAEFKVTGL